MLKIKIKFRALFNINTLIIIILIKKTIWLIERTKGRREMKKLEYKNKGQEPNSIKKE